MASINLREIKTCELVEELKKREGVVTYLVDPEGSEEITVEGPSVVLVVTD